MPSSRYRNALIAVTLAAVGLLPSAAQAQATTFRAFLDGPSEAPPNTSPGTGAAIVTFNPTAHTMRVQITFTGLLAPTTVAHIHCCTALPFAGVAGVATPTPTFPGFPGGVTSGSYDHTFDMTLLSSYRAGFITSFGGSPASAELALLSGMFAGQTYVNIHSTSFPGGEIRGFLREEVVPEPASLALVATGLLGVGLAARRRSKA